MSDEWLSGYVNAKPQDAFQWLLSHAEQPELQTSAETLGGRFSATVENRCRTASPWPVNCPQAPSAMPLLPAPLVIGHEMANLTTEAEALLALCGPSLERDRRAVRD
jgi:hypothetical protein